MRQMVLSVCAVLALLPSSQAQEALTASSAVNPSTANFAKRGNDLLPECKAAVKIGEGNRAGEEALRAVTHT